MTILEKIMLGCIILLFILLVIVLLILKYRKKYTKEKFAFFSVATLSTLAVVIILPILNSNTLLSIIIILVNKFFSLNFTLGQPDWTGKLFSVIIWLGFAYIIIQLHKNWEGAVSTNQHENERIHIQRGILSDTLIQLQYFLKREKFEIYEAKKFFSAGNILRKVDDEKLPWHVQVAELLALISRQYKIDLETDWYGEQKCFISKYGKETNSIGIYCIQSEPSEAEINNFIKFLESQKQKVKKLIIAIKKGLNEKESRIVDGFEIEFRYEQEMLENLVDFSDYHEFVRQQYLEKEISKGSGICIGDIYVESNGRNQNNEEIRSLEEYVINWTYETHDQKHLALLGEYGQGKSVLSLKVTYELLENRTKDSRIPILIELRGKSPRNLTPLEIIANWASSFRIEPQAIQKLHQAGKLLIIFEGFDEMDLVGTMEMRLNHFQRLWEFAIPKSKILISGRPNFFLDDEELKIALGIDKPIEGRPYCEALYLNSFSKEQIKKALRASKNTVLQKILSLLDEQLENHSFYDLISRPATLYLVSLIWEKRNLSKYKNRINSAFIINEFIQHAYTRQIEKKYQTILNVYEREYFMIGIAIGMFKLNQSANQINKEDLNNIILELYKNFPDEVGNIKTAFDTQKWIPLKQKIADYPFAEESILTDVRTCGILVRDLSRIDHFKFAHKSFLEFLVSLFFVNQLLKTDDRFIMITNAISNSLNISYEALIVSDETQSFISELLLNNLEADKSLNINSSFKKLFKLIYPVKLLRNFPKFSLHSDLFMLSSPLKRIAFIILFYSLVGTAMILIKEYYPGLTPLEDAKNGFKLSIMVRYTVLQFIAMLFLLLFSKHYSNVSLRKRTKKLAIWLDCISQLYKKNNMLLKIVPAKVNQEIRKEGKLISRFKGILDNGSV